jgi:hypothetical protein
MANANLIQDQETASPHNPPYPSGRNRPSRVGVVAAMIKREATQTRLPVRLIATARAAAKADTEAAPASASASDKVRSIGDRLQRAKRPGLY